MEYKGMVEDITAYPEYKGKKSKLLYDSKLLCNTIECGWP